MSKKNKIIIIIITIIMLFILTAAAFITYLIKDDSFNRFLASYNDKELKETIYEEFNESFFPAFRDGLIKEGYTKESVDEYIAKLESDFSLTELENETWGCLSQYSVIQMYFKDDEISDKCFDKWLSDFLERNKDADVLLKKK